jgi:excisionase family DNA binding protein
MKVLAGQLSLLEPEPAQDDGPVAPAPARQEATSADKPAQSVTYQRGREAKRTRAAARNPRDENGALLTTDEAAALLHVHPRTVQRLVERGQLCAVHLGSAVRFDPEDVDVLVAEVKRRRQSPAADTARVRRSSTTASFADRLRSQRHEHRTAQA